MRTWRLTTAPLMKKRSTALIAPEVEQKAANEGTRNWKDECTRNWKGGGSCKNQFLQMMVILCGVVALVANYENLTSTVFVANDKDEHASHRVSTLSPSTAPQPSRSPVTLPVTQLPKTVSKSDAKDDKQIEMKNEEKKRRCGSHEREVDAARDNEPPSKDVCKLLWFAGMSEGKRSQCTDGLGGYTNACAAALLSARGGMRTTHYSQCFY
jgi:hypothetical protein